MSAVYRKSVNRPQTSICARPRDYSSVAAPKQDSTVAHVGNTKLELPSTVRPDLGWYSMDVVKVS